ncbi:MAG: AAA family ATPase [Patescibacteria group bacterium]|nr:AAA family ATPase [Patescibacteria group bacterium]
MNQTSALVKETQKLENRLSKITLPPELKIKTLEMIKRLSLMVEHRGYSIEFERTSKYLDWIISLPWTKFSQDRLNLKIAKEILDKHHYGMDQVKEKILEYISVLSLTRSQSNNLNYNNKISRAPILCLVGLVGTGKTTFGPSLAEAMQRKYVRIPFGGLGSARDLRGQSRLHPDAEPGLIIKALKKAQTKNPIFLLDEIDRVGANAQADIMGVLVELLDPEQNSQFTDHYLDYPVDLSNVLFIATANNTRNIATAVLDRLEIIQMPSYTDNEKITIAKNYILPHTLKQSGLTKDNLSLDDDIWPKIVRPLGFDAGIRTLERTIKGICHKIAKLIVEGQTKHIHLTLKNIKNYLPI